MAIVSPFDVESLLEQWTLGDKLQRLALLSPSDLAGIELIVDDAIARRWPTLYQSTTTEQRRH